MRDYADKKSRKQETTQDIGGLVISAAAVLIGAWMINLFAFRSFDVDGPEYARHTLYW